MLAENNSSTIHVVDELYPATLITCSSIEGAPGGIILARKHRMTGHTEMDSSHNLSPVSPKGERLMLLENAYCFGKSANPSDIKLPSHLGRAGG